MKKILSFLGIITLIATSTTSLVAWNTPQYTEDELKKEKEKHKINTDKQEIKENLEWIAPQEKPSKEIGNNKYYFIIWKGLKLDKWTLKKYKDVGLDRTNNLIDKSGSRKKA